MKDPADDAVLLESARSGDRSAIEQLLTRHQGRVYRFGMKMCRDSEDAKDVLQDTLLAAARGLPEFRGASSLSSWLFTIARSYCIKKRRKTSRGAALARASQETSDLEAAVDPGVAPDELASGRQLGVALDAAIDDLDPTSREVLVLRDVEGLSAPEVAQVLGISVDAVKSRLHRARVAVRAKLAPVLGLPHEEAAGDRTCPDVLAAFSRHLEGDISADACARMEAHLTGCARCRGACDSLKQTLALCRTTRSAEVPPQVQALVRAALRGLLTEGT